MSERQGGDVDGEDVEDMTQLSPRTWAEAADEATQLSARVSGDGDDAVDGDATQLSERVREDEDDSTVLARRASGDASATDAGRDDTVRSATSSATLDDSTQVAAAKRRPRSAGRANLPPGRPVAPATDAGAFGTTEPEYGPRSVPITRGAAAAGPASSAADGSERVLAPAQATQRRERARRKRLTTVIVIVCVAAAVVTAAVLAVVALMGAQA